MPNDSINVLLPTPGTPVIPMRMDFPLCGRHSSIICSASSLCLGFALSISVIAALNKDMSPDKIPATYFSNEISSRFFK